MSKPAVFLCTCNACTAEAKDGLHWERVSSRPPHEIRWRRSSAVAQRGYDSHGRLAWMRYMWGAQYARVSPDPNARPVPKVLFVCVYVAQLLRTVLQLIAPARVT